MAEIKVPLEADYEAIALAAGAMPGTARYWNDGTLIVPDIEQAALDSALKTYDHQDVLNRRKAALLENENRPDIEQEIEALKARITKLEAKPTR